MPAVPSSLWCAIGCVVLTMPVASAASSATAPVSEAVNADYSVTTWNRQDGLPGGGVFALAQDTDGYLWVGTDSGLFRFDGVQFTPIVIAESGRAGRQVRALLVARSGEIWAGLGDAVTRVRYDGANYYHEEASIGVVTDLVEDDRGVWAATSTGLYRFDGAEWMLFSGRNGLPSGPAFSAYLDSAAVLIVGTPLGVFSRGRNGEFVQIERALPRPSSTLERARVYDQPHALARDSSGQLWLSDPLAGFRRLGDAVPQRPAANSGRGFGLLYDSADNLWVGTIGQALWRARRDGHGRMQVMGKLTALNGLASDGVYRLFEDADGNIWAGTSDGLSRLTRRRVRQLINYGIVTAVGADDRGHIWIGALHQLVRFEAGDTTPKARIELEGDGLRALHVDRDGTVWAATTSHLFRLPPGQSRLIPLVGRGAPREIDSLCADGAGGVVIADRSHGLMHWRAGKYFPIQLPAALNANRASVLLRDRRDQIWIAFDDGRVVTYEPRERRIRMFDQGAGLLDGVVRHAYETSDGMMWLATRQGVVRWSGDRFVEIGAVREQPIRELTAVVIDRDRNLWLGSGQGIVRIRPSEYEGQADRDNRPVYDVYDRSDGLAGSPVLYSSSSRVAHAKDGTLWFVTSRGVSIIDPRDLPHSPAAASVRVEGLRADDQSLSIASRHQLDPGTSRIEIRYAVVDLTSPFRARFRYRLEGFDNRWIEAGTRRQAFYTNLPPREYRFRVAASTRGEQWNEAATPVVFSIAPQFYQTRSFAVIAIGAASAILAGTWRLRILGMKRQFALVLHERMRLSREVHDTLLQSLVGAALQFDDIAHSDETLSAETRSRFVRMRRQMEDYIRDARQTIHELRSPRLEHADVASALQEMVAQAAADSTVHMVFSISGERTAASPRVEAQALRIGQEAMLNALRHAHATSIEVTVEYLAGAIAVTVRDDGRGFEPDGFADETMHYGMASMKERAEEVNGHLTIQSRPGQGTTVRFVASNHWAPQIAPPPFIGDA